MILKQIVMVLKTFSLNLSWDCEVDMMMMITVVLLVVICTFYSCVCLNKTLSFLDNSFSNSPVHCAKH